MSISDRLDQIESRPVSWPWLDRAADDKRVLVAALRAVLDVCDRVESSIIPRGGFETGQKSTSLTVRAAISAALGEEA